METLFRICHIGSFNNSVQAMMLIFQITSHREVRGCLLFFSLIAVLEAHHLFFFSLSLSHNNYETQNSEI
jgi:hypothetical protein